MQALGCTHMTGGDGSCTMNIAQGCTWVVTGSSALTTLNCAGSIVDGSGSAVSVTGNDGTVYVQGDSSYTITVDSYSSACDTSAAGTLSAWSDRLTEAW